MNERGKSDGSVVAAKLPNNAAGEVAAEVVERRGPVKGNADSKTRPGRRAGQGASNALDRVREVARRDKEARFTALLHHVTVERLRGAYRALRPKAAPGVDGVTWEAYGQDLEHKLQGLHGRLHRGGYRARPSRRVEIPKADGGLRSLGISSLEDKVLQRSVVEVLNAVYESDFLGFSYGFRPGRSQHDALDALTVAISTGKVSWVLDADIRGFFDSVDHDWLMKFIEHRIADKRVLRLIRKWLGAGVLEEGRWRASKEGTPQGANVSPLLANVYLHYAFDLWVDQWRKRHAHGEVIVVRYADDFIVGFQNHDDAQRFWSELRGRLAKFSLELNASKTRLIEFGRFAAERRARRGAGRPETFEFLGFTHICAKTKNGRFKVQRVTSKRRMRARLREVRASLYARRHLPIPEQGRWLGSVVRGHLNYYAVPDNSRAIGAFRDQARRHWLRALRRRSQRSRVTWERMERWSARWIPPARVRHPWPHQRFDVKHPRQEPSALAAHAGICAGGRS
ncbi:MAG: group II intron reverse transcriptase/maturase [Thermoleophilaceae bacterium]|nr:group II intron reverse transcriptase/maturase [Thermoleophilaceae bacterium]